MNYKTNLINKNKNYNLIKKILRIKSMIFQQKLNNKIQNTTIYKKYTNYNKMIIKIK